MNKTQPTCAGLFAGIGGFCFGFEKAGFTTKWVSDFDSHVTAVYRHNFPETQVIERDVKQLKVADDALSPVDVLHAGFPCQSFSIAGNQKGFDDERGKLFFEIIRLIKEFGEARPKVVVLENAPNLQTGGQGEWRDIVLRELQKSGYWVDYENCIIADTKKHGGLPQNRKRLFIVATSQDYFIDNPFTAMPEAETHTPIEEVLDIQKQQGRQYYLDATNKYGEMLTKHLKGKKQYTLAQLRKYIVRDIPFGTCPTLTANMGMGGHNVPFLMDDCGLRKLTEKECLRLQGFSTNFKWPVDIGINRRYKMVGNAVSPKVSLLVAKTIKAELEEMEKSYDESKNGLAFC